MVVLFAMISRVMEAPRVVSVCQVVFFLCVCVGAIIRQDDFLLYLSNVLLFIFRLWEILSCLVLGVFPHDDRRFCIFYENHVLTWQST